MADSGSNSESDIAKPGDQQSDSTAGKPISLSLDSLREDFSSILGPAKTASGDSGANNGSGDSTGDGAGTKTTDGLALNSAYLDFNSVYGPTADAAVTYKGGTLNLAAGGDAFAGLHLNKNVSIMEGSVKTGDWTIGALPTTMGVEPDGPTNSFNTYSNVYNQLRTTALGANYKVDDKLAVGITNDTNKGVGWVPNALEFSYTTPLTPKLNLNLGGDFSLKQATVNANLQYTDDKFSVSADTLHNNKGTAAAVEGTYKVDKDLSVSGRVETDGKKAIAVREQLDQNLFVQVQQENKNTSIEAGWQLHV